MWHKLAAKDLKKEKEEKEAEYYARLPLECWFCDKRFADKEALYEHEKEHEH